ncbi:hypothetical protein [Alkalihalobacterium elongatum]|uniref:hypothetical protein n=1 Tax=Alkalihalobacterium elongatum TaxID=2675466 RepID=UPI001C1F89BA|nr:hypothetical protein [Alkalihalobacterium elongatum]
MILFIGFGKLTKALLPFIKSDNTVYVFHKNERDEQFYNLYNVKYASPATFSKASYVFLSLPASAYSDFFTEYGQYFHKETIFFHMATALTKKEVLSFVKGGKVVPCKCIGQADQMAIDKRGLIVVPENSQEEENWLKSFFTNDMSIMVGREEDVLRINQIATKAALELAVALKKELQGNSFDKEWINQTLEITVRGVIKSYCHQQLGGFGRNLLKEIEKQNGVSENEN